MINVGIGTEVDVITKVGDSNWQLNLATGRIAAELSASPVRTWVAMLLNISATTSLWCGTGVKNSNWKKTKSIQQNIFLEKNISFY